MTEHEFEDCFRMLSKLHELYNELQKISESKFPNPDGFKEDIRCYQQGWNDAIEFIIGGGQWGERNVERA